MAPGRYTVTVGQVRLAGYGTAIASGSLALPSRPHVVVHAAPHRRTVAIAQYGTIVNSTVQRLSVTPVAVQGDPQNPSALALPAGANVPVGTILTATPSTELPAGLFHKVTAVSPSAQGPMVQLTPAHLTDAFPELNIQTPVQFSPGGLAGRQARAAGFDPLTASLGISDVRSCQLPLADSALNVQEHLGLNADIEINFPTVLKFLPTGLPSGKLALTLNGSASLDALLRKNSGCTLSKDLGSKQGWIDVAGAPVPVYAKLSAGGSASVDEDLQATASAGFRLTAGIKFDGRHITNISNASPSGNVSASGAGKLEAGVTVRLAVGVLDASDVHFDVGPAFEFTRNLDGSCSFDLKGDWSVGLSISKLLELNEDGPAANLWHFHSCSSSEKGQAPGSSQGSSGLHPGTPPMFSPASNPPQVTHPGELLVPDLNGDNRPDLVVGDYIANTVSVFLSNGHGGFAPSPQTPLSLGATVGSLAAGNFNGDGKVDLAISNGSDGTVTILLGDGRGDFAPAPGSPITLGGTAGSVAVADFNRDGHEDLAVSTPQNIVVLLGNGTGGFTPAPGSPITSVPFSNGLTVGNFGGAGPDLVALDGESDTAWVLLNNGAGQFSVGANSPVGTGEPNSCAAGSPACLLGAISLTSADFNRDGHADVAVGHDDGKVSVLLGDGHGGLSLAQGSPFAATPGIAAFDLTTGDFDGNGIPDLAVADNYLGAGTVANGVSVLLGDGHGTFSAAPGSPYDLSGVATSVAAADFNGDGRTDIAATDNNSCHGGIVPILLNQGPRGTGRAPAGTFGGDGCSRN